MKTFEEYVKNLNEGIFDGIKGAVKGAVQGYKDASKKQPLSNAVPQEEPKGAHQEEPKGAHQEEPKGAHQEVKPDNIPQKVFYAGTPAQDLGIAIKEIFASLKQKDPESASKIYGLIKDYCQHQNPASALNLFDGILGLKNYKEGTSLFNEIRDIDHSVSETVYSEILKIVQHHGFKLYKPHKIETDELDFSIRTGYGRKVRRMILPGLFDGRNQLIRLAVVELG